MTRRYILSVFVLISAIFTGCDSVIKRHLVISPDAERETQFIRQVEATFDAFAWKHEFTCRMDRETPLLKQCRAIGPRFLDIEAKEGDVVVRLYQPFPGAKWSASKTYIAAADELVNVFRERFGNRVKVKTDA